MEGMEIMSGVTIGVILILGLVFVITYIYSYIEDKNSQVEQPYSYGGLSNTDISISEVDFKLTNSFEKSDANVRIK